MMNDYAMYDLAKQRYADLLHRADQESQRRTVQESQRPRRSRLKRGWHRLAAFAQVLVGRTAA